MDSRMKRTKRKEAIHKPVLSDEVVKAFNIEKLAPLKKRVRIIDATIGAGGHAINLIKKGAFVLGIDADEEMLAKAKKNLSSACSVLNYPVQDSFLLVHSNFKYIDSIAKENGFEDVDGILFDLGVSTLHLKFSNRGFSFENPSAPLDMRIDPATQSVKASDLLNALNKRNLRDLFTEVMERSNANWLTKNIILQRIRKPFSKVEDLLTITNSMKGKRGLHPATLAFLALRIATNSELDILKETLPKSLSILGRDGRLVVISFHSTEDKIVKTFYKSCGQKIITKKPILPSLEEIESNPSSRSAKMRVLQKN